MFKDIKVTSASVSKRLLAWCLDLLILIASYTALYFTFVYVIFGTSFNYVNNANYIHDVNVSLNLNKKEGLDYVEYEDVINEFYFEKYPTQIKQLYDEYYKADYTIEHIYNIQVLSLPEKPTPEYHSNEMFTYKQNSDGTFNVDVIGTVLPELGGYNHEKNMSDYFHYEYAELHNLVVQFDNQFAKAINDNLVYEAISRVSAFFVVVLILYIVIPLTNKNNATIGENICHFAHVNSKNGYVIKRYKTCLRPVVYYLIPLILFYFASNPVFYVLALFYQFMSMIVMLIGENHLDFADKILRMQTVDADDSLIFENELEENEYANSEEFAVVEDEEFLNKLANMKPLNFSSKDEEIKKTISGKENNEQ